MACRVLRACDCTQAVRAYCQTQGTLTTCVGVREERDGNVGRALVLLAACLAASCVRACSVAGTVRLMRGCVRADN